MSQVQNGREYPITFVSRKLLPHEKNYSTVEKECLAVKWAVGKLRYYLLGREFILVTDHAPLKWMAVNKDKNARITRWFLHLQDFKFTVEHRAGRLHGNADALSRRDDCLWTAAPHRGSELRGGVCDGPADEQCPTWRETARRGAPRGMVVEGRYYPRCYQSRRQSGACFKPPSQETQRRRKQAERKERETQGYCTAKETNPLYSLSCTRRNPQKLGRPWPPR